MTEEPNKDEKVDSVAEAADSGSVLRQAVDYSWPEIQRHLSEEAAKEAGDDVDPYEPYWTTDSDGTRVLNMSPDSWWLKDFRREDVLLKLPGVVVMNAKPWRADGIAQTFLEAYDIHQYEDGEDCFAPADIQAQIERFPSGQFMAMRTSGPGAGHVIAMAATMLTARPPTAPVLPWLEAIGDLRLSRHEPEGDWLYGVEMAVRPMYRRRGIGTALYEARFNLARQLNLRGWYAVGMLMGYRQFADKMDVTEYGEKVIAGEIQDPTVTMQMNRGFRAEAVVTNYCDEPAAGDAGVLIVWENPEYEA